MKIIGVIPARYSSTRFPGKPLADICGKPMIWWVYQQVKKSNIKDIYVATDDDRIYDVCSSLDINCVMTKNTHPTSAHRVQEVSDKISADYYVQINGDEPLIKPETINRILDVKVLHDQEFGANLITKIKDPVECIDPTNIKMIFDNDMNTVYMCRTPIPTPYTTINFSYYKHVGVIGYNKKMLDFFVNSKPGPFETIEGIEGLRFVENRKIYKCVMVERSDSLSVDTLKDLEKVRKIIAEEMKNE